MTQHYFNWKFLLFARGSKEDVTNGIRRCSGNPPHDTLCPELYTIAIAQATGRAPQHTNQQLFKKIVNKLVSGPPECDTHMGASMVKSTILDPCTRLS